MKQILAASILALGMGLSNQSPIPAQTSTCSPTTTTCIFAIGPSGSTLIPVPTASALPTVPCSPPTTAGDWTPYALVTGTQLVPQTCFPVIFVPQTGVPVAFDVQQLRQWLTPQAGPSGALVEDATTVPPTIDIAPGLGGLIRTGVVQ